MIDLRFPLYLAVRDPHVALPYVLPAAFEVAVPGEELPRGCLPAWSSRPATAAWCLRRPEPLRPFAIHAVWSLDRLAAVAIGRFRRRWLSLDPDHEGRSVRPLVDLATWLSTRRPWTPALQAFVAAHQLGTLQELSYAI